MHYYIDGYNLLFRLMDTRKNFKLLREKFIEEINHKASLLKMQLSIVFDAHFQSGEGSRSHYDALEILYTPFGETADDYLLSQMKRAKFPHQITIVTSDKKLALRLRHKGALTQSVEEFMDLLNRMYKNKMTPSKSPSRPLKKIHSTDILPASNLIDPTPQTPLQECLDFYAKIFEENYQKQVEAEKPPPKETSKRKPKTPKKSPWPEDQNTPEDEAFGMDRWLKIFEKRSKT